ncbi:hypothetical protein Zmor_015127 [Zophobas morio]|uniref:Uncharacterized protein n=1 Tax=Zophobas morio TaxID=2755281 RepID=A0AA38ILP0_9CUCU|nr:hypothetical protein Zmor_015127 [Zophobas morio]
MSRRPQPQNSMARRHREKGCNREGWMVEQEPHVRHPDGTLYKPDLVIFQSTSRGSSWGTGQLGGWAYYDGHLEKRDAQIVLNKVCMYFPIPEFTRADP